MFGTYKPEDVTILLKDITGLVMPLSTVERERLIQSGVHYSEMLPLEYEPTPEYLSVYEQALKFYAATVAEATAQVAAQIWERKQKRPVLVSLARAGTPIGILIKRYFAKIYHVNVPHYTISIIRGIGIDHNAMRHILARHAAETVQFVDGWIGKGAIQRQLNLALEEYPTVDPTVAVLSDPAHITPLCGTREDFLIPSACLNATVSGLLSRTFLRSDIIAPTDFHGAAFYADLRPQDLTYQFIDNVAAKFPAETPSQPINPPDGRGINETRTIAAAFGVEDINLVKPGIGEATRVLLRRLPQVILVHSLTDERALGHIYRLATEKNVPLKEYPLENYRACGIIRFLGDA